MRTSARRVADPHAGYWLLEGITALVLLVLALALAASVLQALSGRLESIEHSLRDRLELREERLR